MLNLFTVGGVNFSAHIVRNSYKVNRVDEFEEWTDANYTTHRYAGRSRVKGSFELQFMKAADYNTFLSTMSTSKQSNGTYLPTLFINNTNGAESITCYLSFEVGLEQDSNLQLRFPKFKVTVEEQ